MTPEGKTKKRLKALLNEYRNVYQYWPVSNGMGAPALDVIVCANGHYLSIEVKAGDKSMTERQESTSMQIRRAGGTAMLINDNEGWLELTVWLIACGSELIENSRAT